MDTLNSLGFRPEFAILLLTACVIGGGVLGALVRSWSILARLYSLEDRLNVVEATVTREVKIRAGTTRATRTDKDVLQVDEKILKQAPEAALPWWQRVGHLPRSYNEK